MLTEFTLQALSQLASCRPQLKIENIWLLLSSTYSYISFSLFVLTPAVDLSFYFCSNRTRQWWRYCHTNRLGFKPGLVGLEVTILKRYTDLSNGRATEHNSIAGSINVDVCAFAGMSRSWFLTWSCVSCTRQVSPHPQWPLQYRDLWSVFVLSLSFTV